MTNSKKVNIILFGPPGSGKGTQATKLQEHFNLLHISTGELFRYEMKNNTPQGLRAKSYISKGDLVPDEITIAMLKNKVNANPDVKGYIFDGFPRTDAQAIALDLFLKSKNQSITSLIALKVEESEIIKRLLHRGKTSGRADDQDTSIIKNRISVYEKETSIVYDFYAKLQKSVTIEGLGDIDQIFKRLTAEIEKHF